MSVTHSLNKISVRVKPSFDTTSKWLNCVEFNVAMVPLYYQEWITDMTEQVSVGAPIMWPYPRWLILLFWQNSQFFFYMIDWLSLPCLLPMTLAIVVDDLQICDIDRRTCCTREMEKNLALESRTTYKKKLSAITQDDRRRLTMATDKFHSE